MYGNNVVALSAELNQLGAADFRGRDEEPGRRRHSGRLRHGVPGQPAPGDSRWAWTATKFYSFFQEVDYEENFWSEDDMTREDQGDVHQLGIAARRGQSGPAPNTDPKLANLLETIRSASNAELDEAVKRNLLEAIPPESRDVSKIREEDFENIKREVSVNKRRTSGSSSASTRSSPSKLPRRTCSP